MDDATLMERMRPTMAETFERMASASPDAFVLRPEGVVAAVFPGIPDRSVFNSVTFEDAQTLEAALPELAAAYEDAGVRAWTVWVPASDERAATVLEAAGHRLDGEPTAMAMALDQLGPPPEGELELLPDPSPDAVNEVLRRAYGFSNEVAAAFPSGLESLHRYIAVVDESPAASVMTCPTDGDAGIFWVGTVPEARGKGLCARLMHHALSEARQEGCSTTTLQATRAGRPVYARLGYRDLGPIRMWERRRAP